MPPGGRSTAPSNVLRVDSNNVAVSGYLRDVHNAGLSDLPAELLRGKQTVDSYELGMKADWLDGRLRTNLTYFTTDWRNMGGATYVATIYWDTDADGFADVNGLIPCAARCTADGQYEILWFPNLLRSAVNKSVASGAEIELNYLGGDNFQLGANIGILDSEFVDLGDAALGTVPAYSEGDKFAGAPDMTVNVWGQYDWTLGNGAALTGRLDYTWTDDYTTFGRWAAAAHTGGLWAPECARCLRPRTELVGGLGRHEFDRGILQPCVLLHRIAANYGTARSEGPASCTWV